jgi:hypothetical protein
VTKRKYNQDPLIHVGCAGRHARGNGTTEAVSLRLTPELTVRIVLCVAHVQHLREYTGQELDTEAWPDAVPEDAVAA